MSAPVWEYYFIFSDQGLARIEYDRLATDGKRMTDGFTCRLVCWMPDTQCDDHGFPLEGEEHLLNALEAQLRNELLLSGARAKLLARLTYTGVYEWVWMAEAREQFIQVAERWMEGSGHTMEMREEPGWDYMDENILPDDFFKNQILDRRRIEATRLPGSTPVILLHSFTGAETELAVVADELSADQFKEVDKSATQLWMAKEAELDLEKISRLTWALRQFSADMGVMYQGWEARQL
jgi:hypothetical protein